MAQGKIDPPKEDIVKLSQSFPILFSIPMALFLLYMGGLAVALIIPIPGASILLTIAVIPITLIYYNAASLLSIFSILDGRFWKSLASWQTFLFGCYFFLSTQFVKIGALFVGKSFSTLIQTFVGAIVSILYMVFDKMGLKPIFDTIYSVLKALGDFMDVTEPIIIGLGAATSAASDVGDALNPMNW